MPGPLAGLRVLELARILAGPWAGQILADLGADVIKVERKGAGDDTRGWGPPFVPAADGGHLGAAYFHSANRGKRSIELDFESEEGRRIVRKLAARSDVLIENFKVGGLAKFGLDYASLAPDNPRLIYCSVTGFGQTGPNAQRPGYDLMAQGMGGMMDLTGNPDGEPMRAGTPVSDLFTGVYSAVGILAALARREQTGRGGYVDTALVDTTVGVLANQALNFLVSGKVPKRMGNAHPNIIPYQVFPVADGHIIIASGNDSQFAKLCDVLGDPTLPKNPNYIDNKTRLAHRAGADRTVVCAHGKISARRAAAETRGSRRAGRTHQQSRAGVCRSAGDPSRHARRPAKRRGEERNNSRRSNAHHARRRADGCRAPFPATRRALGRDLARDRRRIVAERAAPGGEDAAKLPLAEERAAKPIRAQ